MQTFCLAGTLLARRSPPQSAATSSPRWLGSLAQPPGTAQSPPATASIRQPLVQQVLIERPPKLQNAKPSRELGRAKEGC